MDAMLKKLLKLLNTQTRMSDWHTGGQTKIWGGARAVGLENQHTIICLQQKTNGKQ